MEEDWVFGIIHIVKLVVFWASCCSTAVKVIRVEPMVVGIPEKN